MNKVLIIAPQREEIYYIKFLIDGFLECEYIARESLHEVMLHERETLSNYSAVIVTCNMKGFSEYLELIKSQENTIKTIIIYTTKQKAIIDAHISYSPLISSYDVEKNDLQQFQKNLLLLLKLEQRERRRNSFCKLRISYFIGFDKIICDTFIKLSDEKYVKIINRHQESTDLIVQKYVNKDFKYLYIKENDFKVFVNAITQSITQKNHSNLPVHIGQKSFIPIACQETVHEMVDKMGLSTQALMITNKAINQTMDLVANTDVFKLLQKTLGSGTYISEISMIVTYVSSAICRESEWHTNDNILRLSIASFFQNITLTDDKLAKIEVPHSDRYELRQKEKASIINHPQDAITILNKVSGIPLGVDTIISKHHEKYDGSGFPRGINYSRIEPLSTIFIISLELANCLYEGGFYRDLILDTIHDMEEKYTKGSFTKAVKAMKKAFSIPLLDYEDKELI